jgi:hypothetical protein
LKQPDDANESRVLAMKTRKERPQGFWERKADRPETEVWSIRTRLALKKRVRDLALFNLAGSKTSPQAAR